jgi:hypothetical protein
MSWGFEFFVGFAVISLTLMAILDLFFFFRGGAKETLSYQFWELARKYPVVAFALGFVVGHLVWQYNPDFLDSPKCPPAAALQPPVSR